MIFKAEINPRDFDGYYGMIAYLQDRCVKEVGAGFDTTKIAMGQLTHNSEMCWFEGYVDDAKIVKVHEAAPIVFPAAEFIRKCTYHGKTTLEAADALECVRLDRLGAFTDSPKPAKEANIHIASLGNFHITQNTTEHLHQLKHKIIEILTRAINDASTAS
jgi:hypothetical protein